MATCSPHAHVAPLMRDHPSPRLGSSPSPRPEATGLSHRCCTHEPVSIASLSTVSAAVEKEQSLKLPPSRPAPSLEAKDDTDCRPPPYMQGPSSDPLPISIGVREPPTRLTSDRSTSHLDIERGLGGNGVLAAPDARTEQGRLALTTSFVSSLPLQVQSGFRFKLLTLLWLQLGLTVLLSLVIRFGLPESYLSSAFPAQSVQALVLVLAVAFTLPLLILVRDRHPWNLVATVVWTLLLALMLAAVHIPGGVRFTPRDPRVASLPARHLDILAASQHDPVDA